MAQPMFERIFQEALRSGSVEVTLTPEVPGVLVDVAMVFAERISGAEADAFVADFKAHTGIDVRFARPKRYEIRKRSVMLPDGRFALIEGHADPAAEGGATRLVIRRGTGRVAVIAARLQPPQKGHVELIRRMIAENDEVIVVLGSAQRRREMRHPFSWEERAEMLRCLFGDAIRIVPVQDIDSLDTTDDWINHLLSRLKSKNAPAPTDYYAGSIADAKWYVSYFADYKADRKVREEADITTWESASGRRLHIFKRELNGLTATDVRSLIERRDDDWKAMVPPELHVFIDQNYPPELRVALRCEGSFPGGMPVGTACLRTDYDPPTRFRLTSGGQWLPERPSNAVVRGFEKAAKEE